MIVLIVSRKSLCYHTNAVSSNLVKAGMFEDSSVVLLMADIVAEAVEMTMVIIWQL